jgi:protein-tyrosine phosphatase
MFDVLPDWPEDVGDPAEYLSDRYLEMFASGRRSIATTLELLAREDSYPLVFHCAAGKDRTGILAALVLHILGVEDDVIAADYALSHAAMERLMAWARQQQDVFVRPRNPVPAAVVGARPETMLAFLGKIRERSGGVDSFLTDLGLEPALALQLRDLLLEAA